MTVRCLHVLPVDLHRGAQRYARELTEVLGRPGAEHHTATLFDGPDAALGADHRLGVPSGPGRALLDPRAVARLRRLVRRLEPEYVVAHGSEPLKYAALARGRATLVYYRIGTSSRALANPARGFLHRWLIRRCDALAAVSSAAADELAAVARVPRSSITVIPNGRDPSRYVRTTGGTTGRPSVLFVGRLVATKRPDRYLDAVAAVRRSGRDLAAAIAGTGPLVHAMAERASADGVDMLGDVADVPALLARTDVLVFTSVDEGEGMPGVLIEAALAGVAIVTTDVAGARDVVSDGESGLVVPVDDLTALVDALDRLVDDPALRRRLGDAARDRCARELSLETSAARWEALLAGLDGATATVER